MSKMTAPKSSGNSTTDTPILVMTVGDFQVEVASNNEEGDKDLRNTAKEIRKRYNAHDDLVAELEGLKEIVKGYTNFGIDVIANNKKETKKVKR